MAEAVHIGKAAKVAGVTVDTIRFLSKARTHQECRSQQGRVSIRSLASLNCFWYSGRVSQQSAGTDSASALHVKSIFVDFETLDLGIECSRGQPQYRGCARRA